MAGVKKDGISRRRFLKGTLALTAVGVSRAWPSSLNPSRNRVAVIGAGAFGGWTALALQRSGSQVVLLDSWGPGNSRASSGGESRVIRTIYGPTRIYVEWAARSLQLWKEHEKRWNRKLYTPTGALWMLHKEEDYVSASLPFLQELKLPYEILTREEAAGRYPQIRFEGIRRVLLEKQAGALQAREACQAVVEGFLAEGGEYRMASVKPGTIQSQKLNEIVLSDGSVLEADQFVFACGPWLGKIFPDILKNLIQPTKQEVFYFGTPAGDSRFSEEQMPVWVEFGERLFYGLPGNRHRGFKIADDTRGEPFDPTSGDRRPSQENLDRAREFIARRFPDLKDAPLVEARVCQYENSPDGDFILDRHPEARNVWIAGGGSGHGFKHGPALGEFMADLVLEEKQVNPLFSLSRFTKPPE